MQFIPGKLPTGLDSGPTIYPCIEQLNQWNSNDGTCTHGSKSRWNHSHIPLIDLLMNIRRFLKDSVCEDELSLRHYQEIHNFIAMFSIWKVKWQQWASVLLVNQQFVLIQMRPAWKDQQHSGDEYQHASTYLYQLSYEHNYILTGKFLSNHCKELFPQPLPVSPHDRRHGRCFIKYLESYASL